MDIQPEVKPLKSPEKKTRNKLLKLAIIATAIAVLSSAVIPYAVNNGDDLSPVQSAKITESMSNFAPVKLELVRTDELQKALDTIPLNPQEKQQLVQDLTKQNPEKQKLPANNAPASLTLTDQPQLAWIELWDFAAQDGDIVQVTSGNYSIQVDLLKSPSKISVPVKDNFIQLTGVADGGGGITVGVNTGNAQQLIIKPGTQFLLPISF